MDRATNRQGAMTDLYDADILAWSEHQAALLRRRAAGELVNEADLDWPNLADEIEAWEVNNCTLSSRCSSRFFFTDSGPRHGQTRQMCPIGGGKCGFFKGSSGGGSPHPCGRGLTSPTSIKMRYCCCPTASTATGRCQCRKSARWRWTSC